uniref:Uncharacterized protein n=1 Tax=Arundo donax TaxID=35708 RepID=A0A0A8Z712_ARUDO
MATSMVGSSQILNCLCAFAGGIQKK